MHLTSKKTIQFLCRKYDFWPSRSSGQNFLVSEKTLNKIVESANLNSNDKVLEIGGGFGTLTTALLEKAGQITTVEMDKRLFGALQKISAVSPNLKAVLGDIFQNWKVISAGFPDLSYKLVANLPYNITSLVLRNFLEYQPRPSAMTLLVQKEVADRICAQPGSLSLLSVAVQFFGSPRVISYIPKSDFWPEPQVDSAILQIKEIGKDPNNYLQSLNGLDQKELFKIIKLGFSAKRKQLHNNLSGGLGVTGKEISKILSKIDLNQMIRAQELSINQWIEITKELEILARK
ncbi:MAG: 16S rRNA (adenine(1518)-N(6)/adenine(1519)-N(6))-dimethyltransferase RsmA [Patescibacteria group bacterium]|jgi:16S rRNA (adenine1518-N6/adenine1519-N6)-dimethyltransferase